MKRFYEITSSGCIGLAASLLVLAVLAVPSQQARADEGCGPPSGYECAEGFECVNGNCVLTPVSCLPSDSPVCGPIRTKEECESSVCTGNGHSCACKWDAGPNTCRCP